MVGNISQLVILLSKSLGSSYDIGAATSSNYWLPQTTGLPDDHSIYIPSSSEMSPVSSCSIYIPSSDEINPGPVPSQALDVEDLYIPSDNSEEEVTTHHNDYLEVQVALAAGILDSGLYIPSNGSDVDILEYGPHNLDLEVDLAEEALDNLDTSVQSDSSGSKEPDPGSRPVGPFT